MKRELRRLAQLTEPTGRGVEGPRRAGARCIGSGRALGGGGREASRTDKTHIVTITQKHGSEKRKPMSGKAMLFSGKIE